MERKLVLENGIELIGKAFGSKKECIAELVFNTSMVGYQEILSDPSNLNKGIVMTYPLIGNYGMIDEDYVSKIVAPTMMIVREYNDKPSNFRYTKTLNELLEEDDVAGITHVDTRKLTRILRAEGNMLAILCDTDVSKEEALEKLKAYQKPTDLVSKVSCKKKWYSRCANPQYNVVAVDFGIKYTDVRELNRFGCNVTIVPYTATLETILEINPDGVFLSSGPGNPEELKDAISMIQAIQGLKPVFGVGLGHQLIGLANGMSTYKLKYAHCGSNHPARVLENNKVIIVSQNFDYALKQEDTEVKVTHVNVLDDTILGIEIEKDSMFSVQYQPDAVNNPEDSDTLFSKFIKNMNEMKAGVENA